MHTLGRHLIAEYYRCDVALLNDRETVQSAMIRAAELVGATVLGHNFHQFEPQGISGTVVIAESHLSIHTWPEHGYVAVDIYTCGGLDPRPGIEHIGRALGGERYRMQEIVRGLPDDVEKGVAVLPEDVQIITRMTEDRSLASPTPAR